MGLNLELFIIHNSRFDPHFPGEMDGERREMGSNLEL